MWRTIYLGKLPGLDRKLRVVIDWTLDLFFPRDINLLSPRYSRNLQEAYLEKGDVLFKAGEPAFSFYIVRNGCIKITGTDGETVKLISAGEFFGERALLTDQLWQYTAIAVEDTNLIGLASQEFKDILENSTLMRQLLERSARRYRSSEEIDAMMATLPEELLNRTASSVMTHEVVKVHVEDSVVETLRRFIKDGHEFYPVADGVNGNILGILPRSDFYDFVRFNGLNESATLADIPLSQLPTVTPDTSVAKCLETMVRGGCNQLLIAEEDAQIQGILSIRDMFAEAVVKKVSNA